MSSMYTFIQNISISSSKALSKSIWKADGPFYGPNGVLEYLNPPWCVMISRHCFPSLSYTTCGTLSPHPGSRSCVPLWCRGLACPLGEWYRHQRQCSHLNIWSRWTSLSYSPVSLSSLVIIQPHVEVHLQAPGHPNLATLVDLSQCILSSVG